MANPAELPELVGEFVDLSKEYLRQETLEPAKELGRYTGFSLGAGLAWALAALLFAVAGTRGIIALLPEGVYWSALGYILGAIGLGIAAAIIAALVNRTDPRQEGATAEVTTTEGETQ